MKLSHLSDVFDTSHDRVLSSADADWAYFKVLVTVHAKRGSATTADGTTTLKTLAELGITSINLSPNTTTTTLADGSQIQGTTTFTRADGTTGKAATVAFAADRAGYTVQSTTTVNADGSTTITNRALYADGSLAQQTVLTTSANGLSRTLRYDTTGNGVFDRSQTDNTVINADLSRTETVSNFDGSGKLVSRTTTTTSANGQTVTIARDIDGSGFTRQTEVRSTATDGILTVAIINLNPNGSLQNRSVLTTSADGLTKTTQTDSAGRSVLWCLAATKIQNATVNDNAPWTQLQAAA
jgi:hypothetical protein